MAFGLTSLTKASSPTQPNEGDTNKGKGAFSNDHDYFDLMKQINKQSNGSD